MASTIDMDAVRRILLEATTGESGQSARGLSLAAGLNADAVRDILRGKSGQAKIDTLAALAKALKIDLSEFLGSGSVNVPLPVPNLEIDPPSPSFSGNAANFPNDVPIVGTAQGADFALEQDGLAVLIEQTEMMPGEIRGYTRRPPRISGNKAIYAMQVAGSSMEPRFEIGEVIYVDPRRIPGIGDYVVVQLRNGDDEVICAMVKRLARRNASTIELEQFNPQQRFSLKTCQVAAVHRVVPWSEMLG
ncbi:S24 family peptidase [Sandarakinorhabdus sp. DWP1-3-1]|uniref:S24 family peptidase n=1 Tax=Sandarakinorhabdus sp. DWP1-3-1 TaxID=2804627 RepID=UPI003CEE255A